MELKQQVVVNRMWISSNRFLTHRIFTVEVAKLLPLLILNTWVLYNLRN